MVQADKKRSEEIERAEEKKAIERAEENKAVMLHEERRTVTAVPTSAYPNISPKIVAGKAAPSAATSATAAPKAKSFLTRMFGGKDGAQTSRSLGAQTFCSLPLTTSPTPCFPLQKVVGGLGEPPCPRFSAPFLFFFFSNIPQQN